MGFSWAANRQVPGETPRVTPFRRPSTLLAFHQALVRGKYRRLFSPTPCPEEPRTERAGPGTHPGYRAGILSFLDRDPWLDARCAPCR